MYVGVNRWKDKNMIDFIIANNMWKSAVTKCRTFTGPDTASDHRLAMAGIRIKMMKTQRKDDEQMIMDRGTKRRCDKEIDS